MNKILGIFLIIIIFGGCSSSSSTEKKQNKRNNIINVHNRIKEIVIEDLPINNYSLPLIVDNYLFINDYKSENECIHIFDKNNFKYITSTALKEHEQKQRKYAQKTIAHEVNVADFTGL